ncbi:hypothetical protein MDOR_20100 [Mycolicibacterium doricum]|uniref:Uncharacterized protein n=1 Tax=Mycolicibacterium doricum TaxID=126673 RepID=A0A7I7VTN5_9MYCO|nr:hypothetical protein MDOR_20100 [Mycolicibacterium doricum]
MNVPPDCAAATGADTTPKLAGAKGAVISAIAAATETKGDKADMSIPFGRR